MNQEQLIKMSAWYDLVMCVAVLAICAVVAIKSYPTPIAGFVCAAGIWFQLTYIATIQYMIDDQVNSKLLPKWFKLIALGLQSLSITATILGLSLYIVSV